MGEETVAFQILSESLKITPRPTNQLAALILYCTLGLQQFKF